MKIIHVAPLHRRWDTRVLLKECVSLANSGHDITCVCSDGEGDDYFKGVRLIDCGRPPAGKINRRFSPLYRAFRFVCKEPHDVIHFHDGLFLPFAILLAMRGYRVVYDVHEDYRQHVRNLRFGPIVNEAASLFYRVAEWIGGVLFEAVIAATPHISTYFPPKKTTVVQNYPILDDFDSDKRNDYYSRPMCFTYVGSISKMRGITEIVDAIDDLNNIGAYLRIAGSFSPESLQSSVESRSGWRAVKYYGWIDKAGVLEILNNSRGGMLTLYPRDDYKLSYPIKMFEYMAAGLPVIASDFPLWRSIIERARCGLLVDPLDPSAIAEAMRWVLDNPRDACAMGERGMEAVRDIYNWEVEFEKLSDAYRLLDRTVNGRMD